jgi:hypothetical protein
MPYDVTGQVIEGATLQPILGLLIYRYWVPLLQWPIQDPT